MFLSLDTYFAEKYGVREALFLQNLIYWVKKNADNKMHFHDGRYWTYNSNEALRKWFTFWSAMQIRTIVKSLVEQGAILTGNYNKSGYDKTTWYALSDAIYSDRHYIDLYGEEELTHPFVKTNKGCVDYNDGDVNYSEPLPKEITQSNTQNNIPLISPKGENNGIISDDSAKFDNVSLLKMEMCPFVSEDFKAVWKMLLQQPKWRKKTANAIKMSAQKLKRYEEAFAKYIVELAIANDWRGVIFPDTEERYKKWLQGRQAAKPAGTPQFRSEADKRAYYEGLLNGTIKR